MYLFGMYKLTGICLMNYVEYHKLIKEVSEEYHWDTHAPLPIPMDKRFHVLMLVDRFNTNKLMSYICIICCDVLFGYFVYVEGIQLIRTGWLYFADVWNLLDVTSLCLNYFFLSMFMCN